MSSSYTIKAGDTLWDIAEKFLKDGNRYREIADLNNIPNPNLMHPGCVIKIPDFNEHLSPKSCETTNILVSKSEFDNAVTSNGYPQQSRKYNDFLASLKYASIYSKDEAAMYLAQLLHESYGLQKTKEDYNPLSIQQYGQFIGRGYIQLSTFENYKAAGDNLKEDYVNNPGLVERDPHAWNVTAWYWSTQVHNHVSKGFNATTTYGLRPLQPHHESRIKIYKKVCDAFNLNPKV